MIAALGSAAGHERRLLVQSSMVRCWCGAGTSFAAASPDPVRVGRSTDELARSRQRVRCELGYREGRRHRWRHRKAGASGASVSSRRTPISRPCSWTRSITYPLSSSSLRTTAGKSIPPARNSPSVTGCSPAPRRRSSIRSCCVSTSATSQIVAPASRRPRRAGGRERRSPRRSGRLIVQAAARALPSARDDGAFRIPARRGGPSRRSRRAADWASVFARATSGGPVVVRSAAWWGWGRSWLCEIVRV